MVKKKFNLLLLKKWVLLSELLSLIAITIFLLACHLFFHSQEKISKKVYINIPKGFSTAQISRLLKKKNIIKSEFLFIALAKIFGYEKDLKGGAYLFYENSTEPQILFRLKRRRPYALLVTIPEGVTLKELAYLLEEKGICDAEGFLNYAQKADVLRESGINFPSAEGFLFPDSYEFLSNSAPEVVFEKMAKRFRTVFKKLREEYPSPLSDSVVIILASIVEKEAKLDDERPIIASVFLNRLKKGMKLESCATIEYILPKRKARLELSDLQIPSPYNTYLNHGLPPTPICNPGTKSLISVLSPAKTNYLYFFAKGDGSHSFSTFYKEHQEKLIRKTEQEN